MLNPVKAKVTARKLAFWESLIDVEGEPKRYLEKGEQLYIVGNATTSYAGLFGDKEYFKVQHHVYGLGYVRKEGLEVMQNAEKPEGT